MLLGNGNVDIDTRIRNDKSSDVDHVYPIDSVTMGRRLDGFLGSNSEEWATNPWLAISHVMGPLIFQAKWRNRRPGRSQFCY